MIFSNIELVFQQFSPHCSMDHWSNPWAIKEANWYPQDRLRIFPKVGTSQSICMGDGKDSLIFCLSTPTQAHKKGTLYCNTSLHRPKALTAHPGFITWHGNIFLFFRLNVHSFVLIKHVNNMATGQTHCCTLSW